jgi:RNA-binding motif X-linked protein 2
VAPAHSWHADYRDSHHIFVGGLPFSFAEADVRRVFAQYGKISQVRLACDKVTGKPKGYAFVGFVDQRSTVLAVDNLNGILLSGRAIRVDHVKDYRGEKDAPSLSEQRRLNL